MTDHPSSPAVLPRPPRGGPVAVHHVVDGSADGSPLLLLSSLGGTLAVWEPQVAALVEHFRIVRFDLRGHGESPVPDGPYGIADLGGDAVALLDRLGAERAHLCGLSLGGMAAMWMAVHASERVDRLVLLCTSPLLPPASAWTERAATVRAHGTPAIADSVILRWVTPAFAERSPGIARRLRSMIAATPAEGYAACCEAIAGADLTGELGRIAAPTLVIAGADDPVAPPDHAARIAARVPGARMAVVPDAAHLANVEQPADVTRLILRHLLPAAGA